MSKPGIVFDDVTKVFGDGTVAVRNLSLTVDRGEMVVLVGPSGCGKTTSLRMVAGLETITSGHIEIDGRRVDHLEPRERDVAMVFQSYALYPHKSAFDNIAYPLRLRGVSRSEIATSVKRIAEMLDISELLNRKPKQMSGGQQQRVAMGRAIVRNPAAFLLDEPLSNLDAKLRTDMRSEIARVQAELGVTTLYVTHDQVEAMTMGDRVAVFRAGSVQQFGTPRELYASPANTFVAAAVGNPSMNLITATIRRGSDADMELVIGECNVKLDPDEVSRYGVSAMDQSEVIVGVRPESMSLGDDGHGRRLRGTVALVEDLGNELLVHVDLPLPKTPARLGDDEGGDKATVSTGAFRLKAAIADRPALQSRIDISMKRSALLLFDAGTGAALGRNEKPTTGSSSTKTSLAGRLDALP